MRVTLRQGMAAENLSRGLTRKRSRSPVAARLVTVCALASIVVGLIPSGAALAAPVRRSRLVAAFDGRGSEPSPAARRSVTRLGLNLARPVFRGHADWNIWELESKGK